MTVVVVQQQVPRGGYSLGPEPQKPALPRALDQERAAVAAVFQTTLRALPLTAVRPLLDVDVELLLANSGGSGISPLRINSN